jgi:hypothetical protein
MHILVPICSIFFEKSMLQEKIMGFILILKR